MDPFLPETIAAVMIPLSFLGGLFMVLRFSLRKKELELRRRDLENRTGDPALGDAFQRELTMLRNDHAQLEAQVTELQERVDFTERLLAKGNRPPQVG